MLNAFWQNCKKIWGVDKELDIGLDCDEGPWGHSQAVAREDSGHSYGDMLAMKNVCDESESARNELDWMLRL